MTPFTNIAAYRFARLGELKPLRAHLRESCEAWGLKGTILLSTEGINLFVAGADTGIESLLAELRSIPGLEDLTVKTSTSDHQPFSRMLVRIKKEIIAFGVEGIDPGQRTSPKLSARTLKTWLDEGRPVTLLDTRNDYEVKLGTFRGALPIGVDHFREFPEAVRRLPDSMKDTPVVMFCTGGIRCEKAGPFMEREGFRNVMQLDGGILKYFEECGGAHYDGECFVFDQRVGVDPALRETGSAQCYRCQSPLTPEEKLDPRYVESVSCPYCFRTTEEQMAETIARRHEEIRRATTPLPGRRPYDHYRPINVPAEYDGATLADFLCGLLDHVPREEWLSLCADGKLLDPEKRPVPADHRVRAGERYYRSHPAMTEPDIDPRITILHEDESIVVIDKPAPLPLHPGGRFNRNTLQSVLKTVYYPQKPRPAHRLDANTTGLLVIARTRHFASILQTQFASGTVAKTYIARVIGHPPDDVFACDASIGTDPGEIGSRGIDPQDGLLARTEFQVVSRSQDGTSLLEATPLTGRTNQIRVHLWHLGFPVCGDPAYRPEGRIGETQTLPVGAPPLCLHAWQLSFDHPLTGTPMAFESPQPAWAARP